MSHKFTRTPTISLFVVDKGICTVGKRTEKEELHLTSSRPPTKTPNLKVVNYRTTHIRDLCTGLRRHFFMAWHPGPETETRTVPCRKRGEVRVAVVLPTRQRPRSWCDSGIEDSGLEELESWRPWYLTYVETIPLTEHNAWRPATRLRDGRRMSTDPLF